MLDNGPLRKAIWREIRAENTAEVAEMLNEEYVPEKGSCRLAIDR